MNWRFKVLFLLAALLVWVPAALAQSMFPTPASVNGTVPAPGTVIMCLNGSGLAVPCLTIGGGLEVVTTATSAVGTSASQAQTIQGASGGVPVPVTNGVTYGAPSSAVAVAIGTTVTNVGTAGSYHRIDLQWQGTAGMCVDFTTTDTLTAPNASNVCAQGFYYGPGGVIAYTYTAAAGVVPNTQLRAIAGATGGYLTEQTQ